MRRLVSLAAATTLAGGLWVALAAGPAAAAPGQTSTTHYNTVSDSWGSPPQPPPATNNSNCPAYLLNDFTLFNGTGNGINHQNFNANGFWATGTFTGTGTVVFYPPSSVDVTYDNQGNIVSVTVIGPSDNTATGKVTNWDGVSANKQNLVFGGTLNFHGIDLSSNPVSFHDNFSAVWVPGADQSGFPSSYHNNITC